MKKGQNIIIKMLKLFKIIVWSIIKTIFVSFPQTIKFQWKYNYDPDFKDQIDRKMEAEKIIKDLKERIQLLERIVYSINEDIDYLKSDKGIYDMKELKKRAKRK